MITAVTLGDGGIPASFRTLERLKPEALAIWSFDWADSAPAHLSGIRVSAAEWLAANANLLDFDRLIHRQEDTRCDTCLVLDDVDTEREVAVGQILTRYQRLLWNRRATPPVLSEVLRLHRSLYDLSKPLVRADYDHAIDTWRWLMRLRQNASVALQVAALFHDIERLATEADRRIEHLADDYLAFKERHAREGARTIGNLLSRAALTPEIATRAAELIQRHEQPSTDDEIATLNDADSLSFFSLNSWGFLQYFGRPHTERKVRYTLKRMGNRAKAELPELRLHPDVQHFISRATEEET